MRFTLFSLLLTFTALTTHYLKLAHSSTCTSTSTTMCFGTIKTVKTLQAKKNNTINSPRDLGFNTIDNCAYIDYNSISNLNKSEGDLDIVQLNVRGLKSKLDDLSTLLVDLKLPDVMIISETWLKAGEEKFVNIEGYNFIGAPRPNKKGGGVGFLIRKGLLYRELTELNQLNTSKTFEHYYIELKGDHQNVVLGSIYRPPNTCLETFLSEYKVSLNMACDQKNKQVIVGMDHNINLLKHDTHAKTQEFIEIILDLGLIPVITKPTRVTHSSATLIDNLLISESLQHISTSGVLITDLSDHFPCLLTLKEFNISRKKCQQVIKRKLNKESLDKIKEDLSSYEWENELSNLSTNNAFDLFHHKVQSSIDHHAPERMIHLKPKRINKPWISKNLANSIRKCRTLYKNSVIDPQTSSKYKDYSNTLKRAKRAAKLTYYNNLCNEFRSNSKRLWALINKQIKKTTHKKNIITKIKLDQTEFTQGTEICNAFGRHFSTIGKKFAQKIKKSQHDLDYYCKKIPTNNNSMYMKPTNPEEISNIIGTLANKSSHGYDKISNKLLKELRPVVLTPLVIIFNRSMEEGVFPDAMKIADIVPLHKAKCIEDCNNYRPISLLLTMSKVLEKIIYNRTVTFFDKNKLFYNSQYGFRKNHSCSDAIMELTGEIIKNKENGIHTASVFIDLSKAFDTLDPDILLQKMNKYGIRGLVQDWFRSYLRNRKLRIKCCVDNGQEMSYSDLYEVEYGAPQGSCLGPLLFLIFTNDLCKNLEHCGAILFADDTTVYKGHRSLNYLKWCIETDMANLVDWFRANKLTLNVNKTVMLLFRATDSNNASEYIKVDNMKLYESECTKFLGVWIDNKLNWKKHTTLLINKIKRNSTLLKNTKALFTKNTLKLIYYAHIYSHLTYGINIWGGMVSKETLNKIQRAQNKCLFLVNNKHDPGVQKNETFLSVANLIRLEHLKLGYRMVKGTLPPKILSLLTTDQNNKSLKKIHCYSTRNKSKLNLPNTKNNNYRKSFLYQTNKEIMLLPQKIIALPTLPAFVSSVKKLLTDATT